jgi:hypothetical protein
MTPKTEFWVVMAITIALVTCYNIECVDIIIDSISSYVLKIARFRVKLSKSSVYERFTRLFIRKINSYLRIFYPQNLWIELCVMRC